MNAALCFSSSMRSAGTKAKAGFSRWITLSQKSPGLGMAVSKPVLLSTTDSPLTLTGAESADARNLLTAREVGILDLLPRSSGIADDPRVRFVIDWGDAQSTTSGLLPVLRPHQFLHSYAFPGDYYITVQVMNRDGETSDVEARATLPVRVRQLPDRQRRFFKFSGPSFPTPELRVGISAVEDVFTGLSLGLASSASAGDVEVTLSGIPDLVLRGAEVNFIEDGKLTTFARIISLTGQRAVLDAPLIDSYTVSGCRVEVLNQEARRSSPQASARLDSWFFPIGYDEDLIRSSMSLLFAIDPGELRFRPDVGFRGRQVLFSQADELSARLAEGFVREALAADQRVSPESLRVEVIDNRLMAQLSVRQLQGEQAFDITVPLTDLTNPAPSNL